MFDKLGNKKVVGIIAGLAALSFLLLIYLQWGKGGIGGRSTGELAKVNGHSIYMQDIKSMYEYYKEKYKDALNGENGKEIEKRIIMQALWSVVQRILMLQEADKAKIHISSDQIFNTVIRRKEFRTEDGKFNEWAFKHIPKYYKQKIEKDTEDQLKIEFLQSRIYDGIKVSDLDLRVYFQEKYSRCKIRYIFLKVKERGKNELLADNKLRMEAESKINKALDIIKKGGDLNWAASSIGVRVYTTDYFTFFGRITDLKGNELKDLEVEDTYMNAFRLHKRGEISGKISLNTGFMIVQLVNRENPDWKNFYKELYQLRAEYGAAVKQWYFNDWLRNVERKAKMVSYLNDYFKN